jgi:RibD C-terminal domain
LVERISRYLILVPLAARDTNTVTAAVAERIAGLPDTLRRSLTWDCGSEMAAHAALSVSADIDVYFAHPHSPWERGTNESTNRWIREYLPRGTVIPNDPDRLAAIADELNDRPRRILGYKKPKEVFAELLLQGSASTGWSCDAVATATAAADGKDVVVFGANLAVQCLRAGLLDEIVIHLVPVLLGDGVRLIDDLVLVALERTLATTSGQTTDLRFTVRRRG